jgi:hypothetical protein
LVSGGKRDDFLIPFTNVQLVENKWIAIGEVRNERNGSGEVTGMALVVQKSHLRIWLGSDLNQI